MHPLIEFLGGIRATVFAGLLALALMFSGGMAVYAVVLKSDIKDLETAAATAELEYAAAISAEQARYNTEIDRVRSDYAKSREDTLAIRDDVLAAIASGDARLRGRFKCPSVPAAPGATSGSDGGEGGGLLDKDAEFLVRFASEADLVAEQLKACQNALKAN